MVQEEPSYWQDSKDSHVNLANFVPCCYSAIMDLESQGWIQTTSTYASAEVTSAVVKPFKKYWNTRFLHQNIFLLPIEKSRPSSTKVCRGYCVKAVERLCMPAMRQKMIFRNIRKFSNIQENC